ncbi:hypothetical protein [Fischerella thermalis]|uniref:hypothetical protein n=1 Tax=Fischerella thermalis TaxID=372787 RepID=UPI0002FC33F2|nr:hypothetical protein [Fischerella thermalis]
MDYGFVVRFSSRRNFTSDRLTLWGCSKIVYAIAEKFDTIHYLWGCHSGVSE